MSYHSNPPHHHHWIRKTSNSFPEKGTNDQTRRCFTSPLMASEFSKANSKKKVRKSSPKRRSLSRFFQTNVGSKQKSHIPSVYPLQGQTRCVLCGYSTTIRSNLYRHYRGVHNAKHHEDIARILTSTVNIYGQPFSDLTPEQQTERHVETTLTDRIIESFFADDQCLIKYEYHSE